MLVLQAYKAIQLVLYLSKVHSIFINLLQKEDQDILMNCNEYHLNEAAFLIQASSNF